MKKTRSEQWAVVTCSRGHDHSSQELARSCEAIRAQETKLTPEDVERIRRGVEQVMAPKRQTCADCDCPATARERAMDGARVCIFHEHFETGDCPNCQGGGPGQRDETGAMIEFAAQGKDIKAVFAAGSKGALLADVIHKAGMKLAQRDGYIEKLERVLGRMIAQAEGSANAFDPTGECQNDPMSDAVGFHPLCPACKLVQEAEALLTNGCPVR